MLWSRCWGIGVASENSDRKVTGIKSAGQNGQVFEPSQLPITALSPIFLHNSTE